MIVGEFHLVINFLIREKLNTQIAEHQLENKQMKKATKLSLEPPYLTIFKPDSE
jgi:hypothetical protein